MSSTSSPSPKDSDFTLTVLRKAFELYFEPEIRRRQADGTLPTPFSLWAAQIIMEPGRQAIVNFNDRIVGVLQAKPHGQTPLPIKKGQELRLADLGEIVGMQLPGEFANAGHLTAIAKDSTWYLMFDFRYNSQRIEESVQVAQQFLQTASKAANDGHMNAATENLFAAVEIAAKGYLMIHPYEELLRKHRHGFVSSEFNRYGGKFGNVESKYVTLLNDLTGLRQAARYGTAPLSVPQERFEEWLGTAGAMLEDVMSRRAIPYRGAS